MEENTKRTRKAKENEIPLDLKLGALGAIVDFQLQFEKGLTALKVRQTHLKKNGVVDVETDALLRESIAFKKKFILEPVEKALEVHPAYPWFSRVKGIGNENIAKVITLIDIKRAPTISSLWKFAGYGGDKNGKIDRPEKGKKLPYNKTLKIMCYRVGVALLKADGIAKNGTKFGCLFENFHKDELKKAAEAGLKIADIKDIPKGEEANYRNSLHVHNRAFRRMIKIFLGCLWLYWREAERLPTRDPYAMEKQGHTTLIRPEKMIDR